MILLSLQTATQPGSIGGPESGTAPDGRAFARIFGAGAPDPGSGLPRPETEEAEGTDKETGGGDSVPDLAEPVEQTGPPHKGQEAGHPPPPAPQLAPGQSDQIPAPAPRTDVTAQPQLAAATGMPQRGPSPGATGETGPHRPSNAVPVQTIERGQDRGPAIVRAGPPSDGLAPGQHVAMPQRAPAPAPAQPAPAPAMPSPQPAALAVPLAPPPPGVPPALREDPGGHRHERLSGADGFPTPPQQASPTPADGILRQTPAADTDRPVLRQIALAVAAQTDGTTELRLSPDELGRVRLSLTTADGVVTLAIQAERPETADLIRRNLDLLAQDFRDMGFVGFEFSFGDSPHAWHQRGDNTTLDPDPSDPAQVPAETLILRGLDLRL